MFFKKYATDPKVKLFKMFEELACYHVPHHYQFLLLWVSERERQTVLLSAGMSTRSVRKTQQKYKHCRFQNDEQLPFQLCFSNVFQFTTKQSEKQHF